MFYERFEQLCKAKKVTPSRAVQDMGFSRALASKWKSTGETPKAETMLAISKYFGVNMADLLDENKPAQMDELSVKRKMIVDETEGMTVEQIETLLKLIQLVKEGL